VYENSQHLDSVPGEYENSHHMDSVPEEYENSHHLHSVPGEYENSQHLDSMPGEYENSQQLKCFHFPAKNLHCMPKYLLFPPSSLQMVKHQPAITIYVAVHSRASYVFGLN
jgi:hypothetical protein